MMSYDLLSEEIIMQILTQARDQGATAAILMRVCWTWRRIMFEVIRADQWWQHYRGGDPYPLDIWPRKRVAYHEMNIALFDKGIEEATIFAMAQHYREPLEQYYLLAPPQRVLWLLEGMILTRGADPVITKFLEYDTKSDVGDQPAIRLISMLLKAPRWSTARIRQLAQLMMGITMRDVIGVVVVLVAAAYREHVINHKHSIMLVNADHIRALNEDGFVHCAEYVKRTLGTLEVESDSDSDA